MLLVIQRRANHVVSPIAGPTTTTSTSAHVVSPTVDSDNVKTRRNSLFFRPTSQTIVPE